jgi:hypothetical protein
MNTEKSLYDLYNEQYNTLYYSLYNDIIKKFKEYEEKTGMNTISVEKITTDLLLHPGIDNISFKDDALVLSAKTDYPNITQFISIKFMICLIKYLENN